MTFSKGRKIISGCHIGLIRFSFIENYGVCECTLSRRTFQFVSYLDLIVDFFFQNWREIGNFEQNTYIHRANINIHLI